MIALLMGVKSISCRDVLHRLSDGSACVIDVNTAARSSKARVPGARNLDPQHFARDELPADTSALLVFYCSNPMCRKAPIAARRAKAMGYANVRVMAAGIQGWIAAKLPIEPDASATPVSNVRS